MHEFLKSVSSSKLYKRGFFSFIALLTAIVVAVSCVFYCIFLSPQRTEMDAEVTERLVQIEEQINSELDKLLRIVLAIDRNADGIFTYTPVSTAAQREQICDQLDYYIVNNSFVRDIAYVSRMDEETIFSTQGIFRRSAFERYVYSLTEQFDQEEFTARNKNQSLCTISAEEITAHYAPFEPIGFVYGLPYMTSNPRRFVVFFVDKDQIDTIIRRLLPCEVEDVRIYEKGKLIYSLCGDAGTEGEMDYVHASSRTVYEYHLLARREEVYSNYYHNLYFFFSMLVVTMLLILVSGGMVALYNFNPVYRLLRRVGGQIKSGDGEKDEMALLGDLVEDTILEKQQLARGLFVSNLVWGQYESRATFEEAAREAGVIFEYPLFSCCCARYAPEEDGRALCRRLEEALDTMETMAIALKRHGQNRLTILLNHSENCESEELMTRVFAEMGTRGLHAGLSESGRDVMRLASLHEQAREGMHYATDYEKSFVMHQMIPQKTPEEASAKKETPRENDDLQNRILSCMEKNLRDNGLSLEGLAGECGISASYLVRYFKSCMGVTPMQYVDTLRMDIAKRLLTTTGCSLREIVEQCGYLDESNFARKFKRQEGMTPMNYRKAHWQKNPDGNMQKMT